MKTNPIGQFLSRIPKKATLLGAKGYKTAGAQELQISYRHRGVIYHQSIAMKGGEV